MASFDSNAEKKADKARRLPSFKNFNLIGVKEKVSDILDMIGRVEGIFSTYTKHDISHIDAMLKSLDWLVPPITLKAMTHTDWLLTTLSIYLHDLGMIVTKDEFEKRMENNKFLEFLRSLDKTEEGKKYLARTGKMTEDEKERFFYQEYIRMNHPARIKEWITGKHTTQWGENVKKIADEVARILNALPSRFMENLASVCASHHTDDLDKAEYFPLCEKYGNDPDEIANVQYAAILLRTADLLHITKDRTPSIMYMIIELSDPKGVDEWEKQMATFSVSMKSRVFDPKDTETHIIVVKADFTEESPFFALSEYLAYCDKQIKQSKIWADASQRQADAKDFYFPWHTVNGDIRVEGNEPVLFKFELDKTRLINLLVGHTIYNDPMVAVRELLQNAIDAVRYQYYLDKRIPATERGADATMGKVTVRWRSDERELIVEDGGIGMNRAMIKFNLMRIGSSFYDTRQFHRDYKDFTAISKFGIGILTCFMVSDDIEIITCQQEQGHRIRMTHVHGQYLLKEIEPGDPLLAGLEPHGTKVKIVLRSSIDLDQINIIDIVRYWVILPQCEVLYFEDEEEPIKIGFDDATAALKYYISTSKRLDDASFDIMEYSEEGQRGEKYKLVFPVRKSFAPGRDFVKIRLYDEPTVCIEGIRADNHLPGLTKGRGILSMLSVNGDKNFRTTVSRMNLEIDENYRRIARLCIRKLNLYISEEIERIKMQRGKPLSQASTAGRWLFYSLREAVQMNEYGDMVDREITKLPQIVIEFMDSTKDETKTRRELITGEDLQKIGRFWTIESRLVDNLGIISRDLGKELSLNDFLGKLAPEFRDANMNPIISDGHYVKRLLLRTHQIKNALYSRTNQQTSLEWSRKSKYEENKYMISDKVINLCEKKQDQIIDSISTFNESVFSIEERDGLSTMHSLLDFEEIAVAKISGDVKKVVGLNTRIITVLDPGSMVASNYLNMIKALNKLVDVDRKKTSYDDLVVILTALKIFINECYGGGTFKEYYPSRDMRSGERWRLLISRLNLAMQRLDVDCKFPSDIADMVGYFDSWFDASRYWLDWDKEAY